MSKTLQIRNSTAEFLIFTAQNGENSIEVRYEDKTIWMTQHMIAELFQTSIPNISMHIRNIYEKGELFPEATVQDFLTVRKEGNREVNRKLEYYNLDMIISVGYRVNSVRATQFRRWATSILSQYAIKGYVLDRKRLENGVFLGEDYYEQLLEEIREIRLSERRFYQKITDIYATSVDYDKNAPTTREFFARVQNKLHFAIHGHTAPELIQERAKSDNAHMGLTAWANGPSGKIQKKDVAVAKNYLSKEELASFARIVNAYLELAEDRAIRRIPMTMEDWAVRLDKFLEFDDRNILTDKGSVSKKIASAFAESEFEKYRIVQDKLFESDFDRVVEKAKRIKDKK